MRPPATLLRAESMIGVPYRHLGRDRRGVDCIGHMAYSLDLDENDFDSTRIAQDLGAGYYHSPKWVASDPDAALECSRLLVDTLTKHLLKISLGDRRPGDAVLMSFKIKDRTQVDHAGIIGRKGLIHATKDRGVAVQTIDTRIENRILHIFRKP